MANAYPLQWPIGRARYGSVRVASRFRMGDSAKVAHLLDELEKLHAADIVISTNKQPYSRAKGRLEDPGVAVYFTRKGQQLCVVCDKYIHVEDNIHAVGIAVEAIRTIERHGTSDMVDTAFTGFTALPASIEMGSPDRRTWWQILGVDKDSTASVVRNAYRDMVHMHHPDKGGDQAEFIKVQKAYKEWKETYET